MAARRAPKEGSIFQTDNGRWAVMIELPRKPGGKRNRVMRRARTPGPMLSDFLETSRPSCTRLDQSPTIDGRSQTPSPATKECEPANSYPIQPAAVTAGCSA